MKLICILAAVILGAFQAWGNRFHMNPDGISYLDIASAYLHHNWDGAINAFWSPLYSWLLALAVLSWRPSAYWECPFVHLLNFAIFLLAMGCFDYLWRGLRDKRHGVNSAQQEVLDTFPEWAWWSLGYALFMWTSLVAIGLAYVTPDLTVSAGVYLASGLLLRICKGNQKWHLFLLLGLILGLVSLTKTAIFPVSFIFISMSYFFVPNPRHAKVGILLALITFSLVACPFVTAISKQKGRLTVGDSGKLNYAWRVNRVRDIFWRGEDPTTGNPQHPVRQILWMPAIYEFSSPINATFPPHYDPSYWYEGVDLHFRLGQQIRTLITSSYDYYHGFFLPLSGAISGILILFLMRQQSRSGIRYSSESWALLIPAIAAIGMFALVLVDTRYVGAFVLVLFGTLLSMLHLPNSRESRGLFSVVTMTTLLTVAFSILEPTATVLYRAKYDPKVPAWQVAAFLKEIGAKPGDRIALIGNGYYAYWARLAHVRIVAAIPPDNVDAFWATGPELKQQVLNVLTGTGAMIVVAENVPSNVSPNEWQRARNSEFFVHRLVR